MKKIIYKKMLIIILGFILCIGLGFTEVVHAVTLYESSKQIKLKNNISKLSNRMDENLCLGMLNSSEEKSKVINKNITNENIIVDQDKPKSLSNCGNEKVKQSIISLGENSNLDSNKLKYMDTKDSNYSSYSDSYLKSYFDTSWDEIKKVWKLNGIKGVVLDKGTRITIPTAVFNSSNPKQVFPVQYTANFWYNVKNLSNKTSIKKFQISVQNNIAFESYYGAGLSETVHLNSLFEGWINLSEVNLSGMTWGGIVSTYCMFKNCPNLQSVIFKQIKVKDSTVMGEQKMYNLNNLGHMFENCTSLISIDVENLGNPNNYLFDFHNTNPNLEGMFYNTPSLKNILFDEWKASPTNMAGMFYGSGVRSVDLSMIHFNTVTTTESMFKKSKVETVKLGESGNSWGIIDMNDMFMDTPNLISVDTQNWNIDNLQTGREMFKNSGISGMLDMSTWNKSNLDMTRMFENTPNLRVVDLRSSPLDNCNTSDILGTVNTNITARNQRLIVISSPKLSPHFYQYDFVSESGRKINPIVTLNADSGTFDNGQIILNYIEKICVSPNELELDVFNNWKDIHEPIKQNYQFIGWSPSKVVINPTSIWDLEGIIYTAKYEMKKIILPNKDNIIDNNTMNNGLETTEFGIAYQPKYLTGVGKLLGLDRCSTLNNKAQKGILYLFPTDDQGGSKADFTHVGVKDITNKSNSWELQASFTSTIPTAQLFFENPSIAKNNDGNLISTKEVEIGTTSPTIVPDEVSDGNEYITLPPKGMLTLMKAASYQLQSGVYDFTAKIGILVNDNSKVAAGDYHGDVCWNVINAPK